MPKHYNIYTKLEIDFDSRDGSHIRIREYGLNEEDWEKVQTAFLIMHAHKY